ncbi:hypothetical protein SO802_034415 [Lithocarpus litseifolius]|uniref:Uncharacterized protein n=1 Tax=Lithocarpus litseifolius TaxID=425828 RepID=A0AAW2BFV6_9ROSI
MSMQNGKKGKGRGGGGGGGGGSGRGVRGVDFGLGIGYNPESNNTSPSSVPSRSAAVNSLRTGAMAQFKSKFVAASSNSQNQGLSKQFKCVCQQENITTRLCVWWFNWWRCIQTTISFRPAMSGVNTTSQISTENATQKNPESSRDKPRERRRPSGWDRTIQ